MITATRSKTSTSINFKRNGVKYIAKVMAMNKKTTFARQFINGFDFSINQLAIFEVALTDGDRKYFIVDPATLATTETTLDAIKKENKQDPSAFHFKYMM